MELSAELSLVHEDPIPTRLLEARMAEMSAREDIVSGLRALSLGARATKLFCEEQLDYNELETRALLGDLGLIITTDALTSADPVIRLKIEKLKSWRRLRARNDGVAAYRILSNRTLLSVASQNVNTTEELLKISGFGTRKSESFGREILDLLKTD